MTRQSRTDLAAAVAVMLVGGFFLMLARQIHTPKTQTAAEAMVGPAMVPTLIAALIVALGALEAIAVLMRRKTGAGSVRTVGEPSEFAELSLPVVIRLAAVTGIGFAYVWLLSATGYAISTAITLAMLLVLFRSRPSLNLFILVAAGTAVYYYLFIRLMGIYDPNGWLISLG